MRLKTGTAAQLLSAFSLACVPVTVTCNDLDSRAGWTLWNDSYSGPGQGANEAIDIVFDDAGNVYIVGAVGVGDPDSELMVRKYGPCGIVLWTESFQAMGASGNSGYRTAVALMSDQGVAVLGRGGAGLRLLRLSPSGDVLWDTPNEGAAQGTASEGWDLAVGDDDRIFVVGMAEPADNEYRPWIGVYDPEGILVNERVMGPYGSLVSLAVTPGAGLIAVGDVDGDAWIVSLDPDLVPMWDRRVDGSGDNYDQARSVALLPGGDIVVGGWLTNAQFADSHADAWLARYTDTGLEVWSLTQSLASHSSDGTVAVAVQSDGDIVAVGFLENEFGEASPWIHWIDEANGEVWGFLHAGDIGITASQVFKGLAIGPDDAFGIVGQRRVDPHQAWNGWVRVSGP